MSDYLANLVRRAGGLAPQLATPLQGAAVAKPLPQEAERTRVAPKVEPAAEVLPAAAPISEPPSPAQPANDDVEHAPRPKPMHATENPAARTAPVIFPPASPEPAPRLDRAPGPPLEPPSVKAAPPPPADAEPAPPTAPPVAPAAAEVKTFGQVTLEPAPAEVHRSSPSSPSSPMPRAAPKPPTPAPAQVSAAPRPHIRTVEAHPEPETRAYPTVRAAEPTTDSDLAALSSRTEPVAPHTSTATRIATAPAAAAAVEPTRVSPTPPSPEARSVVAPAPRPTPPPPGTAAPVVTAPAEREQRPELAAPEEPVTVRIGRVEVRMPREEARPAPVEPRGLAPFEASRVHLDRTWY